MRSRSILVVATLFTIVVCASAETIRDSFDRPALASDGGAPPLDLYGNEITEAVARYKIDPAGTRYEEHSPETELPRLRPPQG